jgi:hypothetical protein
VISFLKSRKVIVIFLSHKQHDKNMEQQEEYKSRNGKEKVLTSEMSKMSNSELKLLDEFVGREDIGKCQDMLVLERNEDFSEAQVVVLFKEELFIRWRRHGETIFHNESLGMDSDFKFEWDSATSLSKRDISCISVTRPSLCECAGCADARKKGEPAEQPKYYLLEVMTAAKECSIRVPDKKSAFMLQEYIGQWRFESGAFAKRKKIKTTKTKKK